MQPQPAAIVPAEQPRGRPGRDIDIEPGEEPGGPGQEPRRQQPQPKLFNFRKWFLDRNFETGHSGIKSDYAHVGELLGYSPDYIERLVNGRRAPSRRIVWACRMIDASE